MQYQPKTVLNSIFHALFKTSLKFLLCFVNLLFYLFSSFYMTLEKKQTGIWGPYPRLTLLLSTRARIDVLGEIKILG